MHAPISDKKAFVTELLSRLKSRIESTGESEKDFAKRLGSSEGLFKNLTSGSLPSADRLNVLLSEIGETLVLGDDIEPQLVAPIVVSGTDFAHIPLHEAYLSAGPGVANDDVAIIEHLVFRQEWLRRIGISVERAALVRISGDSMSPGIQPGDIVLIDRTKREIPTRKRTKGGGPPPIYAFIQDGDARVKRIERPESSMLVLLSDNPAFPPELVIDPLPDSFNILGQVVWSGHVWR